MLLALLAADIHVISGVFDALRSNADIANATGVFRLSIGSKHGSLYRRLLAVNGGLSVNGRG
jgi:hypothetical protein